MLDSVAAQAKNSQLARYAAFVTGQLEAMHADHKAHLQFPGVRQTLPQDEIRRGRREGEAWLADLEARYLQDLPGHLARRGATARAAAHLLSSESNVRQGRSS